MPEFNNMGIILLYILHNINNIMSILRPKHGSIYIMI